MSLHRRAARRDRNEVEIVAALTAAGASVTYLSSPGVPDLLVGYQGRTLLLEVKVGLGPRGGRSGGGGSSRPSAGGDGVYSRDQLAWRAGWRGAPPITVRSPAEALAAIGAEVTP